MGQAYKGAPPVELVASTSSSGQQRFSVMRITRGNGPPRRLVHLFRAPVPNPFVNALGSREDFQRDLAAGALGEIPFFCDFCHGFWWPEYHPYAEARLGVDVIFIPIVQSHVCEECGGVWGREAIFQSMPPVWHFAGRQRMERYHWFFLRAEIEYHSRYPGWLTARQYTPLLLKGPGFNGHSGICHFAYSRTMGGKF